MGKLSNLSDYLNQRGNAHFLPTKALPRLPSTAANKTHSKTQPHGLKKPKQSHHRPEPFSSAHGNKSKALQISCGTLFGKQLTCNAN